jgi:ribosomal protein S12 methylthiotransferase accessory factor YcaO
MPLSQPAELSLSGGIAVDSGRWQLSRRLKYAANGVVRILPPEETVRRVRPLMRRIGVTRVAEVTHLDRLGIPNFMAVRPLDEDPGISYYNGKGTTRAAARAGAMMEAVEHYCGERCDQPVRVATHRELTRSGAAVDPESVQVPRTRDYDPRESLEWVEGYDLLGERPTWVPLNSVVCPYAPHSGSALWYSSTNGLASGNCREEALCHALCEVVERDALAIAYAALALRPSVDAVLAELGIGSPEPAPDARSRYPLIDTRQLPRRAARVAARLRSAGLETYLRDLTSAVGVPTFDCTLVEKQLGGQIQAYGGTGTHPDARVAVIRALTEAAQSRVGAIQGGREDLPEVVKPPASIDPDRVFGGGETRQFSSVPSTENEAIDDDVRWLLGRLAAAGFEQAVALDLTRPELGIPVVRVVVPNAEAWTVFHLHTERGALGPRVHRILRREQDAASRESV